MSTLSTRVAAIPTEGTTECHKCPECGVAVPSIRRILVGEDTCIKCHKAQPIIFATRSTYGGGNERVHPIVKMV